MDDCIDRLFSFRVYVYTNNIKWIYWVIYVSMYICMYVFNSNDQRRSYGLEIELRDYGRDQRGEGNMEIMYIDYLYMRL